MEWIGLVALGIVLCLTPYPGKVKRLEATIKRLERKQKGENKMSKLISELVNKNCTIKLNDVMESTLSCYILDSDDEWVKIQYEDKKGKQFTKLIRIENINEVELMG